MLSHWLEAAQSCCAGWEWGRGARLGLGVNVVGSEGHIFMTATGKDLGAHTTQKSRNSIAPGLALSRFLDDISTLFLHVVALLPLVWAPFSTSSLHVVVR